MDLVLQHVGDLPPLDSTPLLVSADLRRVPRSQDRYLATHIAACEREHRGAEVVSLFGADPSSLHPSVQAIISRQYCLYGCGLIYLPCLPPTLGSATVEALLDSLVYWLRLGGEIILCANATSVNTPAQLLQLARHIDDATARVHCDHVENLAYLHLQRQ